MESSSPQTNEIYSHGKENLRDVLINQILIITTVFAVFALLVAFMRAFKLGWYYRDIFQLGIVCSLAVLALIRKNLSTNHKAIVLILLLSVGGLSGVYTLGMLGGTIFLFPMVVVIVAIFYSMRATLLYSLVLLTLLSLVAVKFCSGTGMQTLNANHLMSNFFHWMVYIICLAFFFVVAIATIHNYRSAMKALLNEIQCQRDELIKTNRELLSAKNNIKKLSGLLPICSYCKKIRNDEGYWEQLETYIGQHSEADFSHSICDKCLETKFPKEDADSD